MNAVDRLCHILRKSNNNLVLTTRFFTVPRVGDAIAITNMYQESVDSITSFKVADVAHNLTCYMENGVTHDDGIYLIYVEDME